MNYLFCVLSEKSVRVDIYLSTLFSDFSRSYIQKIIDKGQVSINGTTITKNIKIKNKDILNIEIILENLDEVKAENIPLDIIYEDSDILIINKDAFLNVHPVPGIDGNKNTLVNAILHHCDGKLPNIGGIFRPGIVHRLDKDTSGIILIAKTDKMMNYLSKIIKDREIKKDYLAIVYGRVKEENFRIESFIGRDPNNRLKMTVKNPLNPKEAISNVKLIGYIKDKYSLLKVNIETGRTHQIRVHLSSIGFPIIGDKVYCSKKINDEALLEFGLNRQALHAYELNFNLCGENKLFRAELKNDMKKIIGDLIY